MKPAWRDQPQTPVAIQEEAKRVVNRLTPLAEAKPLGAVSIATTETRIAHALMSVPTDIVCGTPSVASTIWRSTASDEKYIYLTATVACTVNVWVV